MSKGSGNEPFPEDEAKPGPSEVPTSLRSDSQIGANVDAAWIATETEQHTADPFEEWSFLGTVERAPAISVNTRLGEPFDREFLLAPFLDVDQDLSPATLYTRQAVTYADHVPAQACIFMQPKHRVEAIPDDWDPATEFRTTQVVTVASSFTGIKNDPPMDTDPLLPPPQEHPSRLLPVGDAGSGSERLVDVAAFPAASGLSLAEIRQADNSTLTDRAGPMLLNSAASLSSQLSACQHARQEEGIRCPVATQDLKVLGAEQALHASVSVDTTRLYPVDFALTQASADITAHEVSMLALLQKHLVSVRERLCSAAIEATVAPTRWFSFGSRKARLWDEYCRVFNDVVSEIENDTLRSLSADFEPSLRMSNTHADMAPAQRNGSLAD
ncbi:type VI secretion system-associated FHA domain protein (plasmid) [Sinorhizobium meliloti]|nr:type VI secretion system-associated FHA domain protein [Sinorhizobium meliloti]